MIFLCSACATHAPMSEMVMFTPKEVKMIENGKDSVSIHYSKLSFATTYQRSFVNGSNFEEYARNNQLSSFEEGDEYRNSVGGLGMNLIFMFDRVDKLALSLSLFPTLGIDATFRLNDSYYLTYGKTLFSGSQLILQKRIIYNQVLGVSTGLFYDRVFINSYEKINCWIFPVCSEPGGKLANIVGLRFLLLNHEGSKNRQFLNLNTKLGYVIEPGSPYLSIGISAGIF